MTENRTDNDRIAILGGGRFGYVLSLYLSRTLPEIKLWLPEQEKAVKLAETRVVPEPSLNSPVIPANVSPVSGYGIFESGSWTLFVAVQSLQMEDVLDQILNRMDRKGKHTIVILSKGLVSAAQRRRYGVYTFSALADKIAVANGYKDLSTVVVNGPSLLHELHEGLYTFFNISSTDMARAKDISEMLSGEMIHTSLSDDPIGSEIAGVLKNPIAVAAGILSVIPGSGDNARGDLIGFGVKDMLRLGQAMGASPEALLGRSGLSDVISTAITPRGRNRNYGENFVHRLTSGEDRPGMLKKFELFLNPSRYIEKEVLQSQHVAEGVISLSSILDVARDLKIDVPLYSTVYSILVRRNPPEAILSTLGLAIDNKDAVMPVATRKQGMNLSAGSNFVDVMEKRVMFRVSGSRGMISRIKRQSSQVVSQLERRLDEEKEGRKGNRSDIIKELDLWRAFSAASDEEENTRLQKIVRFYVQEISDRYRPGIREALIRMLSPVRGLMGGFRSGSSAPHISGHIDEVKRLSGRYNLFYAPTHKSHLDSVEVAFGLNSLGLPVPRYAAGKVLMSNPFRSWILKSLGAYAVDRKRTRNILYLECLGQYSTLMLEAGIPSLVFPEGTRSRGGGLAQIKTGLLSTAVDAYRNTGSEIIIVPIAISYESIPEDEYFAMGSEKPAFNEYVSRRSGVYMEFCEPIKVSTHMEHESPAVSIAYEISNRWEKGMMLLPNQIIARILTENDYRVSEFDLMNFIEDFVIERQGNYLTKDAGEIAGKGIRILSGRGLIRIEDDNIIGEQIELLNYYASMAPGIAVDSSGVMTDVPE